MFGDLLGRQAYADTVSDGMRLQTIEQAIYEWVTRREQYGSELVNPARWVQRAFESVVGFPRYLLRIAGFSSQVTESGFARVVTVLWSLVVGAFTIGAFIVAIVALLRMD
jgi:hypothetical protein